MPSASHRQAPFRSWRRLERPAQAKGSMAPTRRQTRLLKEKSCFSAPPPCDDIPLGFFHGALATAAAGSPAGAEEDDEREEDLDDALHLRVVALRNAADRRRRFCRLRLPSRTISSLAASGSFRQSAGGTKYRGRDEALWLWSLLSCPPRRLWLWSRRLWLRPRRHTRFGFTRLASAPSRRCSSSLRRRERRRRGRWPSPLCWRPSAAGAPAHFWQRS